MKKIKRTGVSIIVSWIFILIFLALAFSTLYGALKYVNSGNPDSNHAGDLKYSFSTFQAFYEVLIYKAPTYPYPHDIKAAINYHHVIEFLQNAERNPAALIGTLGIVSFMFPGLSWLSVAFFALSALIYLIVKIKMFVLWGRLRKLDRDILSLLCLIGTFLPIIFLDWLVAISSINLYKKAKKRKEEVLNSPTNTWDNSNNNL
ncbi:hypothetical protein OF376_01665 [Ureaplasma miroungigenitalium]|uniref:Uncharacterized protein n=1 Tax=Ureaplasma miroungigenitalium TaxID=1042321 RepID=A0ABT3BN67_9BACT|nr:hypothetical protein [Ureaplasma miroungigenitalium]MCV3728472.1 hypothetical protein [Ureaplasma miroungigenitalium]MCV3734259.1 hypothetical protein [Ureaplasma miroungigenitalium]